MSSPFEIIITKGYGINICMSNQLPHCIKTYSHFVDAKSAAFFADTLEHTLQTASYTDRTRCLCCGKPLSKASELCRLGRGKYAHKRCFFKCYYKGDIEQLPPHTYVDAEPSFDRKLKDFSNLEDSEKYKFTFSIEAVSKKSIHLCMRESSYSRKNNFYLSYDQCMDLISQIRQKLQELEGSVMGTCCYCEGSIHADQDSFVLHDGAKLHRDCLEKFIVSSEASTVQFPASLIRSRDVFGRGHYWR